jgi:hypothetical protein
MAKATRNVPQIDDLVLEARQRYSDGEMGDSDNRRDMLEDLKFTYEPGYQWDATAKSKRVGRPNYTFNRVIGAVNQAIGEQRQVRPSGKVRAVSKDAAASTAEIYGGMIRNIEAVSRAENIYDGQFKYAVAGGYGAWRVLPYYPDPRTFNQDIRLEEIANPLVAIWDPTDPDPCKRHARWAFVAERISKEEYRELYKGFRPTAFQASMDNKGWIGSKDIRVAEYYKKKVTGKTIALLTDGRVVDYDAKTKRILSDLDELRAFGGNKIPKVDRTRLVEVSTVIWCKVDGANILEGPIEYDWNYVPVVRLPGRYVNIEGKQILQSLIRHSKDPQRVYNYHRSTMVETVALTPRSPYLVTPKMIKGHEDQWNTLNAVNRPYIEYDTDSDAIGANGMPKREPPPDVPQALIMLAAQDAEDIRQTTGQVSPQPDVDTNNPESGVSRRFRQASSDSGSYEFLDNLGKAIQLTWDICIDMIPSVIDTDRVVRVLGEDAVEQFVRVNGTDEDGGIMNKLDEGKYEVTVTLGPAFQTQRMESLATLLDAAEQVPLIGDAAADIIAKNLDVREGEELTKRVRQSMIQAGKIQPNEKDLKDMPPAPPPDPVQTGLAKELESKAAKNFAAAQQTQAETVQAAIKAAGAPLEVQKLIDELVGQRLQNMIDAQQLGIGPGGVLIMQQKIEHEAGVG